jgi:hypothetical protein
MTRITMRGCRSGDRKTEREKQRAYGETAAKFQHRELKMTRRDLSDKRPLTLGLAELPLGALRAVDRDLAQVGEVEVPELAGPGYAAALGAADGRERPCGRLHQVRSLLLPVMPVPTGGRLGETIIVCSMAEERAALVEKHRQRIVAAVPEASVFLSGSASVEGLVANDIDLVALVPMWRTRRVVCAASIRRSTKTNGETTGLGFGFLARHRSTSLSLGSARREMLTIVAPGSFSCRTRGFLRSTARSKASASDYEQRKAAFFERVVSLLADS